MSSSVQKTDFLRFNAYSIKDLIIRKLAQDTKYTDQVYSGSNLNVLIDIVSYMYQCLIYQLNNAASESMFKDTQLYENISRLCKFIGYNPRGMAPASLNVIITNGTYSVSEDSISYSILPFTRIDTGLKDSNGKSIYFSTVQSTETGSVQSKTLKMYNGEWKLYSTVFTSSGEEGEVFELTDLRSSQEDDQYVANDYIRVYVSSENADSDTQSTDVEEWKHDKNELFVGSDGLENTSTPSFSKLYSADQKTFSIRLNENKNYEIKFGNDVICKKLNKNDKVYIFYLDTNGEDGEIDMLEADITEQKFQHNPQMFGLTTEIYNEMFGIRSDIKYIHDDDADYSIQFQYDSLVGYKRDETVEQIRENAPNWFKTGNRLITRQDYEYYIKNTYSEVVDIKCMNNWEYLATFYRWLYYYGVNPNENIVVRTKTLKGGLTYLDQYRLESEDYKYVDASDACNVYLWTKLKNLDIESFNQTIDDDLQSIKTMTAEIYAIPPVDVSFSVCASDQDEEIDRLNGLTDMYSYIEVTLQDNSIYVAATIQTMVANIITDYFSINNCRIGQLVKYDDVLNQIYNINGVSNVRTVYHNENSESKDRYYDGLSFSSYSLNILETGEDLQIGNTSRRLEDFQFPVLGMTKEQLIDKITVIKKVFNSSNPIKF